MSVNATDCAFDPRQEAEASPRIEPKIRGRRSPQVDAPKVLDELFDLARRYRTTPEYAELMRFVARFRWYSPFNAMLVHIQMSGAQYVAPAGRWLRDYDRHIRPQARPLVLLQPRGPVMFVFDVSDTRPGEPARPLPPDVDRPFDVTGGYVGTEYGMTIENAKRDGVRTNARKDGSQSAGLIHASAPHDFLRVLDRLKPEPPTYVDVPLRYEVLFNANHSKETQYATLVHELAHLYCGHLGTPNKRWWPDRRFVDRKLGEFEAESVSYLVCRRLDIETPAAKYLASYYAEEQATPAMSLDCVMKAAGLIEQMGKTRLRPRRNDENG